MFKNKLFWYFCMMPGAVAGWLFTFFGFLFPIQNETVRILWIVIACAWGIGHILELAFSLPVGKTKGIPVSTVVLKTIALGITWWLPLKLGIIER
jgi:hypothetical protein